MDLPDEFYTRLIAIRGGCSCMNPNSSPPCLACTDPMTDPEANEILSDLAEHLPRREALRLQTILIENGYDGTIEA